MGDNIDIGLQINDKMNILAHNNWLVINNHVIIGGLINSGHETFVTMASGGGGDKWRLKLLGFCKSKIWKYFGFL